MIEEREGERERRQWQIIEKREKLGGWGRKEMESKG